MHTAQCIPLAARCKLLSGQSSVLLQPLCSLRSAVHLTCGCALASFAACSSATRIVASCPHRYAQLIASSQVRYRQHSTALERLGLHKVSTPRCSCGMRAAMLSVQSAAVHCCTTARRDQACCLNIAIASPPMRACVRAASAATSMLGQLSSMRAGARMLSVRPRHAGSAQCHSIQ